MIPLGECAGASVRRGCGNWGAALGGALAAVALVAGARGQSAQGETPRADPPESLKAGTQVSPEPGPQGVPAGDAARAGDAAALKVEGSGARNEGPPGNQIKGDSSATDIASELEEDVAERHAAVEDFFLEGPFVWLRKQTEALNDKTGLKLGFAYTMLFQQGTGGAGNRTAASGDLDLLASWTAIGRGTKDTGTLYFAAEYRNQIGSQPPSALGGQIGSITGTTNGFSERTMVVKEFYWKEAHFDGRFVWGMGRADPENLFGGHKLQSANFYFLNQAFSTNPTVAYPGCGLTAAAALKPVDWFYVGGGVANANGNTTTVNFEDFFDEREFLTFGEVGYTPKIENVGAGRYRVSAWHIDERDKAGVPSDEGVSVIADQELGERTTVFARYGWAEDGIKNVKQIAEAGGAVNGLIGGKENQTGFAAAWVRPTDSALRDQEVLEVYQRFQVTPQTQLTLGAQLIIDPSNAPGDDAVGVFSVRLRFSF